VPAPRSLAAGPPMGQSVRQEAGVVAMGELARQYALGAELLQAAVGPRMGGAIRGRLEGGLLYTAAYLARVKAQARAQG